MDLGVGEGGAGKGGIRRRVTVARGSVRTQENCRAKHPRDCGKNGLIISHLKQGGIPPMLQMRDDDS
jgi:hypothetical protein